MELPKMPNLTGEEALLPGPYQSQALGSVIHSQILLRSKRQKVDTSGITRAMDWEHIRAVGKRSPAGYAIQ